MLDLFVTHWPQNLFSFLFLQTVWCSDMTAPKIISNTPTQLHSLWKMDKKAHRKQKPWKMIYDPPNHRNVDSHGTITLPRFSAKYGRSFAGEFLLYRLQTWPIRTGLRSQTTSAIITNDWRSPGNTDPVRIGLKTSEPGNVNRRGFLRDFPMGFYNGVFQFMSKIKPMVNIMWQYFDVLFDSVICTHSQPKRSYLVTY